MHKTAQRIITKSKRGEQLTRFEQGYLSCYIAHHEHSRETKKLESNIKRLKGGAKR